MFPNPLRNHSVPQCGSTGGLQWNDCHGISAIFRWEEELCHVRSVGNFIDNNYQLFFSQVNQIRQKLKIILEKALPRSNCRGQWPQPTKHKISFQFPGFRSCFLTKIINMNTFSIHLIPLSVLYLLSNDKVDAKYNRICFLSKSEIGWYYVVWMQSIIAEEES